MSQMLDTITDTLTRRPEVGILSSIAPITMSTTELMQLIGVVLGVFIASITGILKILELKDRLAERKKNKMNSEKKEGS